MQIRIRTTGAVMYESEFRASFPNTSMPQQLSESLLNDLGADVVFEGPQATGGDVYQYSQAQGSLPRSCAVRHTHPSTTTDPPSRPGDL